MKKRTKQRYPQRSGKKILIIAEGENTEPIYFTELCRFYVKIKGLVKVIPQGNPGIESMIGTARRELKASRRIKGLMSPLPYEKAYILIDRDHFANEPNGISRLVEAIKSIAPNENIEIILSSPCFEFWFFLHFLRERPFDSGVVFSKFERELKRASIIPPDGHYSKEEEKASQIIQRLVHLGKLKDACENSVWAGRQSLEREMWNKHPYTNVHEIIRTLGLWGV